MFFNKVPSRILYNGWNDQALRDLKRIVLAYLHKIEIDAYHNTRSSSRVTFGAIETHDAILVRTAGASHFYKRRSSATEGRLQKLETSYFCVTMFLYVISYVV